MSEQKAWRSKYESPYFLATANEKLAVKHAYTAGRTDALKESAIVDAVEAIKSAHDEFVERHNKNSDWHVRYHIDELSKALSALEQLLKDGES